VNKESPKTMVNAPALKRGFTLIELMVTIAVLGVLFAVAIPGFQRIVVNNRMASQANDLISALSLARSEAVKRAANVTVCASSNGSTCTGTWAQGWIVRDAAGNVIRVFSALGAASTLTGSADVASQVVFNASGATTLAAEATLTLCPPSPPVVQGRVIEIERSGRPRVANATTCA
jgi:type IV fimbrial biogenesis protein FimT